MSTDENQITLIAFFSEKGVGSLREERGTKMLFDRHNLSQICDWQKHFASSRDNGSSPQLSAVTE